MTMRSLLLVASSVSLVSAEVGRYSLPAPWSWKCDTSNSSVKVTGHVVESQCVKTPSAKTGQVQSLMACKMTCHKAGLIWPAPTGPVSLSTDLLNFLPNNLKVVAVIVPSEKVSNMVNQFVDVFREYLYMMSPDYEGGYKNPFSESPYLSGGSVEISIKIEDDDLSLTTDTDESYSLKIQRVIKDDPG